jgi:DNA-binding NtrC family response regulator
MQPHGPLRAPRGPATPPAGAEAQPGTAPTGLRGELEAYERARVAEVLQACAGNQTEAARRLGMARRTLVKRLAQWGFPRPRKR